MLDENEISEDTALKQQFQSEQLRKEAGMPEDRVKNAEEEYAAELTPSMISVQQASKAAYPKHSPHTSHSNEEKVMEGIDPMVMVAAAPSRTFGYIALFVAISSLFIWPALLGPTAAVFGIIAYLRGSKALGAWSIILGLLALAAYFILIPFYS